jgi:hypothetical protein
MYLPFNDVNEVATSLWAKLLDQRHRHGAVLANEIRHWEIAAPIRHDGERRD